MPPPIAPPSPIPKIQNATRGRKATLSEPKAPLTARNTLASNVSTMRLIQRRPAAHEA
jgi:hypothetical protein